MANGRELHSMAFLHGHEIRRPRLCCGADTVQHAEGGEPLEQVGANHLRRRHVGERRHVLHSSLVAKTGGITRNKGEGSGIEWAGARGDKPMGT